MSYSSNDSAYITGDSTAKKKYKGVRCRKWGKWVSEIRVPGTPDRLWLGSYATPEAAAVAHDVASYCLRGNTSSGNFNFPLVLPAGAALGISPRSVQRAASDAGLAVDARLSGSRVDSRQQYECSGINNRDHLDISVDDYL
ncbi:Ethylene-responsive transcription factor ERF020 [Striga hermonthica]|uniref:Ethylene-responsive transcription factor ERF020 n=1 Tax=Striga hermonthica TaxID=68872 RepID=A0A9N7MNV2_STRHE|nr:Ethylene-responsive transcription factor ERF020 [Striga hermonthica]